MDKQKGRYGFRKIFFVTFLLVTLLGVFYIPVRYTDRFFTSGMIWLGFSIPAFAVVYFLFMARCIHFSWFWGYAFLLTGFYGLYAWVAEVFQWQQFFYLLVLLLGGFLFSQARGILKLKDIALCLTVTAGVQALLGIAQYVGWFSRFNVRFPVTGTFDNPAGLAMFLALCFPFSLSFVFSAIFRERIGGIFVAGIMMLAVLFSGSRTGLIALLLIMGITSWQYFKPGRGVRRLLVMLGLVLGLVSAMGLYRFKKDSADGRLSIWRCTWEMIREKPLLGHGPGSFGGKYMLFQADYLQRHPDQRLEMLADNVKHPFNEYLKVWAELGLLGIVLIGVGMIRLIRQCLRQERVMWPALISWMAFMVCGLFSYPLNYPSICLLLALDFGLLAGEGKADLRVRWGAKLVFAMIPAGLLVFAFYWQRMEVRWTQVAHRALVGEEDVLPEYARLYPFLSENPLFLYNYGAELKERKLWLESAAELKKCSRLLNDTDVQLLLGEDYSQAGCIDQAEACLLLASQMCPNRFLPLYHLVRLYDAAGRKKEAGYWAGIIVEKPVKVQSYMVNRIKKQMEEYLKEQKEGIDNFLE